MIIKGRCDICNRESKSYFDDNLFECKKCKTVICIDCLRKNKLDIEDEYVYKRIVKSKGEAIIRYNHCPVCNVEDVTFQELFEYILKQSNKSLDEFKSECLIMKKLSK